MTNVTHIFSTLAQVFWSPTRNKMHTPLHPHPQLGVTADVANFDRFPQPNPQTNGVSDMVKNDIANEQPEQTGFRCNTTETNGYTTRTPAQAEVRSGAKGN